MLIKAHDFLIHSMLVLQTIWEAIIIKSNQIRITGNLTRQIQSSYSLKRIEIERLKTSLLRFYLLICSFRE